MSANIRSDSMLEDKYFKNIAELGMDSSMGGSYNGFENATISVLVEESLGKMSKKNEPYQLLLVSDATGSKIIMYMSGEVRQALDRKGGIQKGKIYTMSVSGVIHPYKDAYFLKNAMQLKAAVKMFQCDTPDLNQKVKNLVLKELTLTVDSVTEPDMGSKKIVFTDSKGVKYYLRLWSEQDQYHYAWETAKTATLQRIYVSKEEGIAKAISLTKNDFTVIHLD